MIFFSAYLYSFEHHTIRNVIIELNIYISHHVDSETRIL